MASLLRGGKYESGEQEDIAVIQVRDDDALSRLVVVKVVSSEPGFIYFEGSVSSGLGMGYERKVFGLSNQKNGSAFS